MNGLGRKLVHAVAIAGFLSGLAATPALADHHKHWKKHKHGHSRYYRDRDYDYRPRTYYREYDRHAYYGPRAYYSPPGVYVHPAPPSFGLSLVFPIH